MLVLAFLGWRFGFGSLRTVRATETSTWTGWASNAWNYFKSNYNPTTGLHYAASGWHYFTDWDLAGYIIAIMDAQRIGVISQQEADNRLNKIVTFLQNRPFNTAVSPALPYWAYDANDPYTTNNYYGHTTDAADTGRLLIALSLLKGYRPDLAGSIDNAVNRYSSKIRDFAQQLGPDFYGYYVAQGYILFGYTVSNADAMSRLASGPTVTTYGITLPATWTTSEIFLHGLLELNMDPQFQYYARQAYLAQESRYNHEHLFTGWSEGRGIESTYIWEWIATADSRTWVVQKTNLNPPPDKIDTAETRVLYTKAAFGLHALYETSYTQSLVNAVQPLQTSGGFSEGMSEDGSKRISDLLGNTQSIIISAARYATQCVGGCTVTFDTSPRVAPITIDGSTIPPLQLPYTATWAYGSSHTFGVDALVAGDAGTRYVFSGWSDGSTSAEHPQVTVLRSGSYAASFNTEYHLSVDTSPPGLAQPTVSPAGPWYASGTLVTLTAQTVSGYRFDHWSLDGIDQSQGVTTLQITMNAPHSATTFYVALTPDFTVSLVNPSVNLVAGEAAAYTVTLGSINNFAGEVTVSVSSGLPPGVSSSPVSATLSANSEVTVGVQLTSSPETSAGTYSPTISAVSGSITHSTSATLVVKGLSAITLSVDPSSVSYGGGVTLSGQLTPSSLSGVTVTVWYSLDGGSTWVVFMRLRTSGGGSYEATWVPPYVYDYLLKASWDGNQDYAEASSSASTLSVSGTRPQSPGLLLSTGGSSYSRGSSIPITVTVFNPTSETITATLYIEVTNSAGYLYRDMKSIQISPAGHETYILTIQIVPDASPGTYALVAGLIPPTLGAFDLIYLEII
jgi:hypothetical protein